MYISLIPFSDGKDDDRSGDHLRPLLAAPAHSHPGGRPTRGDLGLPLHSGGLDLLPLACHEQLLLQPYGVLLDELQVQERLQVRPPLLPLCHIREQRA